MTNTVVSTADQTNDDTVILATGNWLSLKANSYRDGQRKMTFLRPPSGLKHSLFHGYLKNANVETRPTVLGVDGAADS